MTYPDLRGKLWGLAAGMLAAVAVYVVLALWAGKSAYIEAITRVSLLALAAGAALSSVNFLLRFLRWHLFLRAAGAFVPLRYSAWIFLSGLAFTITPGKAGEAVKSVFCRDFGVPYGTTLAIVWLERLFDLLAVAALFSLGMFTLGASGWQLGAVVWAALLGIMGAVHTDSGRRATLRLLRRWQKPLSGWFSELDRIGARRLWVPVFLLSAAGWMCEGVAFWWILRNLSVPVGPGFAQSAYFAATLAGVFFPGGIGGTEGALVWALSGMAAAPVVAAAVTAIRAVTLGWATLTGLAAASWLLLRRQKFWERKDSE